MGHPKLGRLSGVSNPPNPVFRRNPTHYPVQNKPRERESPSDKGRIHPFTPKDTIRKSAAVVAEFFANASNRKAQERFERRPAEVS